MIKHHSNHLANEDTGSSAKPLDDAAGGLGEKRRNVLLLPYHEPSLQELLIVADAMQADGRYKPVIVLPNPSLEQHVRRKGVDDIDILRLYEMKTGSGQPSPPVKPDGRKTAWNARAKSLLRILPTEGVRTSLPFAMFQVLRTIRSLRSYQLQARQVFDKMEPTSLLLMEERHFGVELAFTQIAREKGCLTVVVPFAYYSSYQDLAFARKDKPLYFLDSGPQRPLNRWIRGRYPNQVYKSPQGPLLFYSPAKTIALAAMNMLPANPWYLGGGFSDLVATSGEEDRETYIRMGASADKIVVTGQPSHDNLYRLSRNTHELVTMIARKYSLDNKKCVICAVPQLAEHHFVDWPRHWQEIRFLTSCLTQTGANVLLSLHPKSDARQYHFLEQEFGVHILQEPLREVLPVADLFVATFSSTVRWAVLLGVPTVVVDFYGFNYDLYDHLGGVVKVKDKGSLVSVLQRVLEDQEYHNHLRFEQQKAAQRIAPFDGRANERIVDLIQAHTRR